MSNSTFYCLDAALTTCNIHYHHNNVTIKSVDQVSDVFVFISVKKNEKTPQANHIPNLIYRQKKDQTKVDKC